jgi:hypothetical protein
MGVDKEEWVQHAKEQVDSGRSQTTLNVGGDDGEDRQEWREYMEENLMELAQDTLPEMAKESGWPISQDHCFLRVAYDCAFNADWRGKVDGSPAYKHMPDKYLQRAHAVLCRMKSDGHEYVARQNEKSLWLRDKVEKDDMEYYYP